MQKGYEKRNTSLCADNANSKWIGGFGGLDSLIFFQVIMKERFWSQVIAAFKDF